MAGKRPKLGWIYMINPHLVSLRCQKGHQHIYNLNAPGEVICKTDFCDLTINSSRVLRGFHPYIVWENNEFKENTNYLQTFTVIPLTSQDTFAGLPTTYPITTNQKNGLSNKSYALVNQICTVDGNCFKDNLGNWLERLGQLDKYDQEEIKKRLRYYLNLNNEPDDDWFKKNASPELLKKVFEQIPDKNKEEALNNLLDNLP